MSSLAPILEHLTRLVACDTRNPPRAHTLASPVFDYLRTTLSGCTVTEWDHGDGSVSQLFVRGQPGTLFNYHLDTVPVAQGWDTDPFLLTHDTQRATGLGACDIKGALAVMLAAATHTKGDVAILVTSDEEAGNSVCVREFLNTTPEFENVFVAEPTSCKAVTSHYGIVSGRLTFCGSTGHASSANAVDDNAIHRAMNWGAKAQSAVHGAPPYTDSLLSNTRFNIGRIEGGVKPNMIASSATLGFSLRTPPAQDQEAVITALLDLADTTHIEEAVFPFQAPPLPGAKRGQNALTAATALAERNGIACADAVSFWTEAALFSAAGINAIVLGSGDIAQAHTANEWVALDDLQSLHSIYTRLIQHGIK